MCVNVKREIAVVVIFRYSVFCVVLHSDNFRTEIIRQKGMDEGSLAFA
jgi:hypothetical protein